MRSEVTAALEGLHRAPGPAPPQPQGRGPQNARGLATKLLFYAPLHPIRDPSRRVGARGPGGRMGWQSIRPHRGRGEGSAGSNRSSPLHEGATICVPVTQSPLRKQHFPLLMTVGKGCRHTGGLRSATHEECRGSGQLRPIGCSSGNDGCFGRGPRHFLSSSTEPSSHINDVRLAPVGLSLHPG